MKNYAKIVIMFIEYMNKAMEKAEYKQLEDGTWFAEIPGFEGVWGNGKTVEEACKDLWEVLEEWILLKIHDGDVLPVMGGIELKIAPAGV